MMPIRSFADMLPNSWHAGAGLELMGYRSVSPFPDGVDVSLVGEVTYTSTNLGIDDWVRIYGSGDVGCAIPSNESLRAGQILCAADTLLSCFYQSG